MEQVTVVVTWDGNTTTITITQPKGLLFPNHKPIEAWRQHPDHEAAMKAKTFHLKFLVS